MENVKNYLVCFDTGENVCVYVSVDGVDANVLTRFAENVCKEHVRDCYEVSQEDLQYYCIDGRVWVDTPQKAKELMRQAQC